MVLSPHLIQSTPLPHLGPQQRPHMISHDNLTRPWFPVKISHDNLTRPWFSVWLSVRPSICLSVCLSVCLHVMYAVHVCMYACHVCMSCMHVMYACMPDLTTANLYGVCATVAHLSWTLRLTVQRFRFLLFFVLSIFLFALSIFLFALPNLYGMYVMYACHVCMPIDLEQRTT